MTRSSVKRHRHRVRGRARRGARGHDHVRGHQHRQQGHRVLRLRRGRPDHGRGREHRAGPHPQLHRRGARAGRLRDGLQAGHGRRRHPRAVHRHRAAPAAAEPTTRSSPRRPPTTSAMSPRRPTRCCRDHGVRRRGQGRRRRQAKALFPWPASYWERIEPVAESFGDLDPKIDGREADVVDEGDEVHRLPPPREGPLGRRPAARLIGAIADQLIADVKDLVTQVPRPSSSTPLQLANGAKELLDEVATGKITGEEDALLAHRPVGLPGQRRGLQAASRRCARSLQKRDPALVTDTRRPRFKAVGDAAREIPRRVTGSCSTPR